MKFSAFVIAALSGVASAADFNLRSYFTGASTIDSKATVDPADVRVIVHGLAEEISKDEMQIISKSIIEAYNEAYKPSGHFLEAFKAHTASELGCWVPGCGAECRLCPNDDDQKEPEFVGQKILAHVEAGQWGAGNADGLGDAHKKFENNFCTMLRASGSDNLKAVSECYLSFLTTGAEGSSLPIKTDKGCGMKQMEGNVMMRGILHDFSYDDIALINKSVQEAYNDAFSTVGYSLGSFEAVNYLDVFAGCWWPGCTSECRLCPNDDDMASLGEAKLIVAKMAPLCPNDNVGPPAVNKAKLEFIHEAFEKALCAKLANSGSANFANVQGCSFSMVTDPFSSAETIQQ